MTTELLLDAVRPSIDTGKVPGAVVGYLRDDQLWVGAARRASAQRIVPDPDDHLAGRGPLRVLVR